MTRWYVKRDGEVAAGPFKTMREAQNVAEEMAYDPVRKCFPAGGPVFSIVKGA